MLNSPDRARDSQGPWFCAPPRKLKSRFWGPVRYATRKYRRLFTLDSSGLIAPPTPLRRPRVRPINPMRVVHRFLAHENGASVRQQADRALPSEGRGHKFESCRARQKRLCSWYVRRGARSGAFRIPAPCKHHVSSRPAPPFLPGPRGMGNNPVNVGFLESSRVLCQST